MIELEGLAELEKKLEQIGGATAEKALRQAVMNASTPAFKAIKMAAPVGKRAHRTYKGRLVAPGFLRRNIVRRSRIHRGHNKTWASVVIGVRDEAFYGVQFLERGTSKMAARPWLAKTFARYRPQMEQRLKEQLRRKIERIARG